VLPLQLLINVLCATIIAMPTLCVRQEEEWGDASSVSVGGHQELSAAHSESFNSFIKQNFDDDEDLYEMLKPDEVRTLRIV
jgi:hypothetical protein